MNEDGETRKNWLDRLGLFLVFLLCGLVAYLPKVLDPVFPNKVEIPLRIGISVVFLVVAVILKGSERLKLYWRALFAFFVVSTAQFIDWHFSHWTHRLLNIELETPAGLAIDKLESTLLILGFVWGYVIQKTDSLWGSVLFHAGTDIPIVIGLLSNL